ncbi:hypothetical protein D9Q98_006427 [Chlorella vulgaris]|uniref:E2F-associated phosphoprotein n=1 Tax=Chlorella vulgaris TaxID=3077 RepID=A0A9D4TKA0_CHLVU|nr:hypothetical protein D9Q98_006427 [Chlorella vulgaris]
MAWDMSESDDSREGSLSDGSEVSAAEAAALGIQAQAAEFYDEEADERDEKWMQKMRGVHTSDAILSCPLCFTTVCIDCQQHELYDSQFRAMLVMNCKVKTGELVTVPSQVSKRQQKKQRRQELQRQQLADKEQQEQGMKPEAQQQQQQQQQQQPQQQQGQQQPEPVSAAAGAEQPPQQQDQPQAVGMETVAAPTEPDSQLNPVCCAACGTEVGLRDAADGVYHFFNVFASNP